MKGSRLTSHKFSIFTIIIYLRLSIYTVDAIYTREGRSRHHTPGGGSGRDFSLFIPVYLVQWRAVSVVVSRCT